MIRSILEIFVTTAEAGSFEKASKQLFISSTALIKQIKRLEQESSLTHKLQKGTHTHERNIKNNRNPLLLP